MHWRQGLSSDELGDMTRATHQLDTPFLSELVLYYPQSLLRDKHRDGRDNIHYYSTWSMPRLASLTMGNSIPVPFTASASLSYLKITLNYEEYRGRPEQILSALIQFLANCPVLRTFALQMFCLKLRQAVESPLGIPTEFSSIETLDLNFSLCEGSLIKSFFHVARFPNASTMDLRVVSYTIVAYVHDVIFAVLLDSGGFPRLTNIKLDVQSVYAYQLPVSALFPSLSNVQHLTLIMHNSGMSGIGEGPCLPALRSLAFKNCRQLEQEWVADLLGRLKTQGTIPQLTVEDCRWRKEDRGSETESETDSDDDSEEDSSSSEHNSGSSETSDHSQKPQPLLITKEEMFYLIA